MEAVIKVAIYMIYISILPLVLTKPTTNVLFKKINLQHLRCGGSKPSYCCDNKQLYAPFIKPTRSLINKVQEWINDKNKKCNNLCSSSILVPKKIGIPYSYNAVDQALNYNISLFKVIGKFN